MSEEQEKGWQLLDPPEVDIPSLTVGIFTPGTSDANSFYRGWGPWFSLAKMSNHVVRLKEIKGGINWQTLYDVDLIYMCRPGGNEGVALCKALVSAGIPLWVDYDDNYFELPKDNPALIQTKNIAETVEEICKLATVVSVPTQELADVFHTKGFKPIVIPNALDIPWWSRTLGSAGKTPYQDLGNVFYWRGGISQRDNVKYYLSSLEKFAEVQGMWVFQGYDVFGKSSTNKESDSLYKPLKCPFSPSKLLTLPWDIIPRCFQKAYQIRPTFNIVMHTDTLFERCKSKNAWMEATAMGAVSVVPDNPEYDLPGTLKYKAGDTTSFEAVLQACVEMTPEEKHARVGMSMSHLMKSCTVDLANRLRLTILSRMFSPPEETENG